MHKIIRKHFSFVANQIRMFSGDKGKIKLLDVGSAKERYLEKFLPENVEYYSLDLADNSDYKVNLDKFPYPLKSNQFDIVVCLETLEHVCYPPKVVSELKRIAKPKALMILSMPNEYNFYCRLNYLFARKTSVNLPPFEIVERHRHIHLPRAEDIVSFASKNIKVKLVRYNWYSRSSFFGKTHLIRALSSFADKIIKTMMLLNPSLFSRNVTIVGLNP
jgi:SAM-dependent methyltransferase